MLFILSSVNCYCKFI